MPWRRSDEQRRSHRPGESSAPARPSWPRNRCTSSVEVKPGTAGSKIESESLPGQNAARARAASNAATTARDRGGAELTTEYPPSPPGVWGLSNVRPVSPISTNSSRRCAAIAACTTAGMGGGGLHAVSLLRSPMSTGVPPSRSVGLGLPCVGTGVPSVTSPKDHTAPLPPGDSAIYICVNGRARISAPTRRSTAPTHKQRARPRFCRFMSVLRVSKS